MDMALSDLDVKLWKVQEARIRLKMIDASIAVHRAAGDHGKVERLLRVRAAVVARMDEEARSRTRRFRRDPPA